MRAPGPIRVMLADDHEVVRSGLRRLLEQHADIEVAAEADCGEQAYRTFGLILPDVLVLDLSMPGMGGIEAIRRVTARYPDANIVVFSMHENAFFASQALKAGARAYVAKTDVPAEFIQAVRQAARGASFVGAVVNRKLLAQEAESGDLLALLSAREFEVFRMFAEGIPAEQVAHNLKISQKTVANYVTMIKQKLGVSTPIGMLRLAIRFGIVDSGLT